MVGLRHRKATVGAADLRLFQTLSDDRSIERPGFAGDRLFDQQERIVRMTRVLRRLLVEAFAIGIGQPDEPGALRIVRCEFRCDEQATALNVRSFGGRSRLLDELGIGDGRRIIDRLFL